jgi:hypothetical protein
VERFLIVSRLIFRFFPFFLRRQNMCRIIAGIVCFFAAAGLNTTDSATVSAGDVLLLSHFNYSLTPEFTVGEKTVGGRFASVTGGCRGYAFTESRPSPEALDVKERTSWLSYPATKNISLNEGTVQFWVSPLWKREKVETAYLPAQTRGMPSPMCVFFRMFFGKDEDRMRVPWKNDEDRFHIYKSENKEIMSFHHNGGCISHDIGDWEYGSWHQVGITWKPDEALFYINGRAVGKNRYRRPEAEPEEIMLGSPFYGNDAESLIDELRILSRAQSPEEMRRDYLTQLRGEEFRAAGEENADAEAEVFTPVTPKTVERRSALIDETVKAHYTDEVMKVDGTLDEKTWNSAQEITGFKKRGAKPEDAPEENQSFVKIAYDNRFIYFGARFIEPNMAEFQAKHDQRDLPIFSDDCLEVVFDTRNSAETFYHFVGNLIGGIYDSRGGDKNWSAYGSICKGVKGKNEWTLEMAIPFADLGIPRPIFGEVWGVRICRERKPSREVGGGGENTSWPTTSFPFFTRNDLAKLLFLGKAGEKDTVKVTAETEKFSLGLNALNVGLADLSGKKRKLTLCATLLGDNNSVVDVTEISGTLPADGNATLGLDIPVRSDNISLIALTLNDEKGSPIWGRQLRPEFAPSSLRLCDAAAALPDMRGDVNYISKSKDRISEGVRKSVELLEKYIADFEAKTTASIAEKRPLPLEEWERMRGVLAGFEQWKARHGFLVWETDPWSDGTPHDLPAAAAAAPELVFAQAGNEREVRAICLRGMLVGGRKDVRLVPSFLSKVGEDPEKIDGKLSYVPARKIRIYSVPYLRDGFRRLRADALIENPTGVVALTPAKTDKYFVVFDSRDVPPGEYVGYVEIKPADTEDGDRATWRRIPLKITVWDFALPETKDWPLDCYLWYGGTSLVGANETGMINFLHDYHINWVMTDRYQYDVGKVENRTGSHGDYSLRTALARNHPDFKSDNRKATDEVYVEENIRTQDIFLKEAKRLGMKVMFAWGCCKNVEQQIKLRDHLFSLGYTYTDYAIQGMRDEFLADNLEQPGNLPFHRRMYAADPKIQFMVTLTTTPPPAGCTYEQLDEVAKYCKIWTRFQARAWPPESEHARKDVEFFKAHDTKFWTYQCSTQMQNWPSLDYYRLYPIRGVLMGSQGISYWTFNSNKGDPFDHGDGYDEGITYLDPKDNSPISTVRLEALRDGLEDAAYMRILEKLIAEAKAKDPNRDLSEAEALITTAAREMHDAKSWEKLLTWRKKMAKAILEAMPLTTGVK